MSEPLDSVLQQMAELTTTIKEHGWPDPTLDRDALVAEFEGMLKAHRAALLDEIPDRPGAFTTEPINRAVDAYEGRYKGMLSDIARSGCVKFGNWKLRGSDLVLAHEFMSRAYGLKESGVSFEGRDMVKAPSEDLSRAAKALTATGTGTGDELVPTGFAAELWEDFFTASRIVSDLPTQPMPTDPFPIGLGFGDFTWRKGTEAKASEGADPATAQSLLTSTEQVAEVDWGYDFDEDAVIAVMPAIRQRGVISGGEQMDAFCLNADKTNAATGNINLDDANPDDDSYYLSKGQDGIRHLYIVDNTGQHVDAGGDALADADMTSVLNKLDKYGVQLEEARIVPGIAAYFGMVGLTNVSTVDKYGPQATILRGELARYRGVPVIPSASQPLAEADGKVCKTAASNTLGTISVYNRTMWKVGFRRQLLIEVDRDIQRRKLIMVLSFRIAIATHGTRSSAKHTAGIRNILV